MLPLYTLFTSLLCCFPFNVVLMFAVFANKFNAAFQLRTIFCKLSQHLEVYYAAGCVLYCILETVYLHDPLHLEFFVHTMA